MKFARHCCQLLLLALLSPTAAWALGLGDIHLKSSLDAPLDADIDLVDANAEDLSTLKATLAPRDTFKRLGADYPTFLGAITLTPERTPDGRAFIHLHSAGVANEPFATLLVELDWARGHLVREYTVLLDPPVFNAQARSNANVAAPAAGSSARSGTVDRAASGANAPAAASASPPSNASGATGSSAPSASSASNAPAASPSAPSTGSSSGSRPGSYTVQAGDTLSRIAAQVYGGDRVTRARALVAIYRANPAAFRDNMNVLYSGSVLKLPGDSELEAIGPGEAGAEVRQQYASWRDAHGGERVASAGADARGQLRLVAPQESAQPGATQAPSVSGAGSTSGAAGGAGTAGLQQRVQQLESQLAESQRLLQMRNAELAALQARLQQQGASRPAPGSSTAVPAANPPAANPNPASPPVATPTPPAARATPPATAPRNAAKLAKAAAAKAAAPAASLLGLLSRYWYVPAALLAVLIAALAVRRMRARQEDAFDRSLGELAQPVEPPAPMRNDTIPVRPISALREEPSYRVEESGSHQRPVFESPPETHADDVRVEESAAPADAPVALDQGDPLAEADFHMAYGLYDQAAELVQIALTREPKRRDLRMKLLEVFFVWGNRDRFLQTAHELAASRDEAAPGEWEKILIMGRQIAPEEALFADSRGMAGAAKVVDLNLEGGQNRVDFDLLGEPSLGTHPQDPAVELDLGAALGEPSATEATGEASQLPPSDVDFVIEGPEHDDATGTTREMPEAAAGGADITGLRPAPAGASTETMNMVAEADAPTVEQPQIRSGDHGTIRQKIDAATRSSMVSGEQTAELAIDDLGLDLGSLDGHGEEGAPEAPPLVDPDAPTLLADVDEETRRMLEEAEAPKAEPSGTDATQKAPAVGGARPNATGTWMFTDTDFAQIAPTPKANPTQVMTQIAQQPQVETGSTSAAISALRSGDLDLDLGSLESLKPQATNGVDLDVGVPATGDGGYVDTQRIGRDALVVDDVSPPDLEPVTMSEVGTKLDLARAYMDMGDPEGARSILSEVMSEGSMSQKQEARRLMDALPG